jgi:hypothetical protein
VQFKLSGGFVSSSGKIRCFSAARKGEMTIYAACLPTRHCEVIMLHFSSAKMGNDDSYSLPPTRHCEVITLHFSSAKMGNDDSYSLPADPVIAR